MNSTNITNDNGNFSKIEQNKINYVSFGIIKHINSTLIISNTDDLKNLLTLKSNIIPKEIITDISEVTGTNKN
jgi:hypothetical protein